MAQGRSGPAATGARPAGSAPRQSTPSALWPWTETRHAGSARARSTASRDGLGEARAVLGLDPQQPPRDRVRADARGERRRTPRGGSRARRASARRRPRWAGPPRAAWGCTRPSRGGAPRPAPKAPASVRVPFVSTATQKPAPWSAATSAASACRSGSPPVRTAKRTGPGHAPHLGDEVGRVEADAAADAEVGVAPQRAVGARAGGVAQRGRAASPVHRLHPARRTNTAGRPAQKPSPWSVLQTARTR